MKMLRPQPCQVTVETGFLTERQNESNAASSLEFNNEFKFRYQNIE
jgi:hypothetical protein